MQRNFTIKKCNFIKIIKIFELDLIVDNFRKKIVIIIRRVYGMVKQIFNLYRVESKISLKGHRDSINFLLFGKPFISSASRVIHSIRWSSQ